MAREQEVITLKKPLTGHDGPIKQIIIREPSFDEYLMFGDPWTIAGAADGTPFGVENMEVIKQYLAVCLVEPKDIALLSQSGASVAREVKERLLRFFRHDEVATGGSAT